MKKAITFEYGGYHFEPYMKLTGKFGTFEYMAMNCDHKIALISGRDFSHEEFYKKSPFKDCDLFRCIENGKIYIPGRNLMEYTGELHGIHPCFYRKSKEVD